MLQLSEAQHSCTNSVPEWQVHATQCLALARTAKTSPAAQARRLCSMRDEVAIRQHKDVHVAVK